MTATPLPGWSRATEHSTVGPQGADRDPLRTADRLMIAERIHRYGWGYDERNVDMLGDCFTDEGVWEGSLMGGDRVGPYRGRSEVVAFLTDFWKIQDDQRRHIFTNIVVEFSTADRAVAHAYLQLTASDGAVMRAVTTGPYRLVLHAEAGVWRIAHLLAGFDAPF